MNWKKGFSSRNLDQANRFIVSVWSRNLNKNLGIFFCNIVYYEMLLFNDKALSFCDGEKKMFAAFVILLSAIVVVSVMFKRPLMLCYKQVKMRIWHWFMIWKIERKIEKKLSYA
jgi:hypothetical protein